ncbi:MAG: pilus assembly protein PilM, partial [Planctomycetota bacterium]
MSWKLLKTRAMPVGIDVGTGTVKLVQLRRTADELELAAIASAAVPEACQSDPQSKLGFLAESLPKLLKSGGFQGRECVLSLPATETFIEHVKTAKVPHEELFRALRVELQGKFPFDPADAIIRHVVAGETFSEGEVGLEVIVLAAARGVIEGYIDLARKARL